MTCSPLFIFGLVNREGALVKPIRSQRYLLLKIILVAVYLCASVAQASAKHLSGTVSVQGGKKLKNLVVFLEPLGQTKADSGHIKHKVLQKGRKFNPGFLVIKKGDIVQYLNDEDKDIDHNIYSLSYIKSFDLGLGERGTILETPFENFGGLNYFCSVHKMMEGKLVVVPSRHYTILDQPGSFILPDVPPGQWKLSVFVFHRRFKAVPLEISVGSDSLEHLVIEVVKK